MPGENFPMAPHYTEHKNVVNKSLRQSCHCSLTSCPNQSPIMLVLLLPLQHTNLLNFPQRESSMTPQCLYASYYLVQLQGLLLLNLQFKVQFHWPPSVKSHNHLPLPNPKPSALLYSPLLKSLHAYPNNPKSK